jgi:hypothetical protein
MLSSYASSLGINDLNTGSANTAFMQLVALMVARSSGDIFQILRDFSLDRATGPALKNLGIEYGVPPIGSATATSSITVTDLSFQKIATVIYAGTNPPIPGSTTINVSDASQFPATGTIYLGRGTVNIESRPYTLITPIGSYYAITLSLPTTRFHNIGESIILSQGGVRTVPINTVVVSPGVGTTASVQYFVTNAGIILDGETVVTNVPITAQLPGATNGNVPGGAISKFSANPPGLSNASVTNPLAVTTGRDAETDEQYRVRIKNALASTGLGTVTAIESALQGVQDPTGSDSIVSTDVLNSATNTTVYIDNGAILEATHTGVAIEAIVNSALGGEKFFQLVTGGTQTSVTKAILQSVAAEPFALFGGEYLEVIVGNVTYPHVFVAADFANPGSATAYEVCASINGDTSLNYEAVTAGNGTYVVIRPEDQVTDIIQVTTPPVIIPPLTDANTVLQFPSQKGETLRLFKNGRLLTEDGVTASIFTQDQGLWSSNLATNVTFGLSVDGTAPVTYILTDAMFLAEGTYTTLSRTNNLQSWVNVLNTNIAGITASIVGSTIEISSNLGAIDRAKITVVPTAFPSLTDEGVISSTDLTSTGIASDYILDRNTAQIELTSALVKKDLLSAGTYITQANIQAGNIPSGLVTLTSDAHVWISIDTNATIIPTIQRGSTLSVSTISPTIVRYTSNANSFLNVLPGDYVIIWSTEIHSTDDLEGRVHAVSGNTLDIKITVAEYSLVTPVSNAPFVQGFVVVRTANVPQKFKVQSSISAQDIYAIAAELQLQTDEVTFGVVNDANITVTTNTLGNEGQITVVTADSFGALLGFVGGTNSVSQEALTAFYETKATTAELPLFFHSTISADSYAEPIDTYLTNFSSTLSLSSFDPNELINFLNPYGVQPVISGGSSSSLLGSAATFALLATSMITNTGPSTITGDVGVTPSGFITPGGWTLVGTTHTNDGAAATARTDAQTAYTSLMGMTPTGTSGGHINSELGGQFLGPGVYVATSGTAGTFTLNGILTLTGNGVYVFQAPLSTIITGGTGTPVITLAGGASASNIYWVANSSITINSGFTGIFEGTAIASASVGDTLGGTVNGRLIALTAAVTLSATTIVTAPASLPAGGVLTLVSGTGDTTIAYSAFTIPLQPLQYAFTVTSANATVGAVYSTNGLFFTVSTTIVGGTTLTLVGAGLIDDEQPSEETVQMWATAGTSVTILPEYPDVRRLRVADRYYVANPLDFGYNDTVVVIVDNNTVGETYTMPLYRRAIVNSLWPANDYSFDAYDVDAGATASFDDNFTGFDFSNFKALMQAKYVIQSALVPQTALLLRSILWGRSGENINVSYVYPTSANQPIGSNVTITSADNVSIEISLMSGNPINFPGITSNTQWNVSTTGQRTFTVPTAAAATVGAVYTNNGHIFTVTTTKVTSVGTTLVTTSSGVPSASGILTKITGTGDATIAFSAFVFSGIDEVTYTYAGNYTFTVLLAAAATVGAVYTNNGQTFTVTTTKAGGTGTTLVATNSGGAPTASGTLTKVSGTGDTTIAFSAFTFLGAGTAPNLTLSGGEYVTILPSTGFNIEDTGTFRVSTAVGFTPTSTSFSVQVPAGTAFAQSNVLTIAASGMSFYNSSPTTAAAINTYINNNLTQYITSSIVNDGGTSGSGVIALSSYEDSGFVTPFYYLNDGINWIANDGQYVFTVTAANATEGALYTTLNSNNQLQYFTVITTISGGTSLNMAGSIGTPPVSGILVLVRGDGDAAITYSAVSPRPQFTFKEPLTYATPPLAPGYSFFTSGDEVRLIPTTMDQVQRLWSILAVTGFTTVGTVEVVDRGTKLQLATNTLGSVGAIQIVGGSGNEYTVPVLTSGELLGNNEMLVSANNIASQAMASDQWFRLQAQNYQNKDTGIGNNTSVAIVNNNPSGGDSTITLLNQELGQLYFGGPRNNVSVEGRTFRIEKQGSLACLSWNGVGTSPGFSSSVNFNDLGGWVVNVSALGVYSISSTPAPTPSILASAATYAALGASAVVGSAIASTLTGNLGIYPNNVSSITNLPPSTYTGTENAGNAAAQTAQADALVAYNTMAAEVATPIPAILDGQTLTPGVYTEITGTFNLATSTAGTLTFNGAGTYIIHATSTLVTGAGGTPTMTLINGALASNIYWIVGSSATINSGHTGTFQGNVIASASIGVTLGGTVNGSLIALNAAVTLSAATIINSQSTSAPLVAGHTSFSGLTVGDLITISGLLNASNNGTFFITSVSPDGLSFTVSNSSAVVETGTAVLSGAFTATSSVSEGDTLIIYPPFAPINQGQYRVIRMSEDSVWYEDPRAKAFPTVVNILEEEVTCIANPVTTTFDATTGFNVSILNGIETISWNGTGTPMMFPFNLPIQGNVATFGSGFLNTYTFTVTSATANALDTYTDGLGNTFTVVTSIASGTTLVTTSPGAPTTSSGSLARVTGSGTNPILFSSVTITPVNQGSFVVVGSGSTQPQIAQFIFPLATSFTPSGPGQYFELFSGTPGNKYAIWYNVSPGSNVAPIVPGFTLIGVTINSGDSAATVALKTYTAINGFMVGLTASYVSLSNVVAVTTTASATTFPPTIPVSMPTGFSFAITQLGQTAFISVINPSAVVQTGISSVTFSINNPQIQFFPYESTVPGDKLVVNGNALGAGNAGTYQILYVTSPTTVVVSGNVFSTISPINLAGNSTSVAVQEGVAYTGYKQVDFISPQEGVANFNNIVFNTSAQYEKIDPAADIGMVALNKLNFPVTVRTGIDAYNYDTGLIGQANRVIYGDPRDPVTYPGVNAAGTNIFIREPLLKRVFIALAIRTNIGVSFAQIANQIRSSVYALVSSNLIGESIDLSSIVETVRLIPGVTSVVLTSPTYDVASDEIVLVTGQKAIIINQTSDITVSLIGS